MQIQSQDHMYGLKIPLKRMKQSELIRELICHQCCSKLPIALQILKKTRVSAIF
jgi:hypothetical protein